MEEEVCCLLCGSVQWPLVPGMFNNVIEPACANCAMDRNVLFDEYNVNQSSVDKLPSSADCATIVNLDPRPSLIELKKIMHESKNKGIIIYTDGSVGVVTFEPKPRKSGSRLATFQQLIKGNMQILPLDDKCCLILNENCKNIGLPYNQFGSRFWRTFIGDSDFSNIQYYNLVGNAVIVSNVIANQ